MLPADSPSDNREDQVIVVLAARSPGPHFVEPERRLTFTLQNPTIPIGRASKVSSKGFVAASDNAWFDSPVMSRGHAEFSVDFHTNPKTVYIKDIGSLHGTFHKRGDGTDGLGKEDKLEQGQMVKLESGDTLRFGIDIYRSMETFPPCYVDFLIEEAVDHSDHVQPHKSEAPLSRGFSVSVPEDDFDDEDLMSDDDSIIEAGMLLPPQHQNQTLSLSSGTTKRTPVIDLNEGDAKPSFTQGANSIFLHSSATVRNTIDSDVIDLTSEPDHDDGPATTIRRRPSTPFPVVQTRAMDIEPVSSTLNVLPKPMGSAPLTSDIADDNSATDTPVNAIHSAGLTLLGLPQHDYGNSAMSESESESESPRQTSEELDVNLTDSEDESVMSAISDEFADHPSSHDSGMGDSASSELGNEYGVADDLDDEDDEDIHNTQYSDSSTSSVDEPDDPRFVGRLSPLWDSTPSSPSEPEPKESTPKLSDNSGSKAEQHAGDVMSHVLTGVNPSAAFLRRPRLPSPSDAAMVKTIPLDKSCTTSTAQALGDKTGKYEFFAARECNKAVFVDPPTSGIRETLNEGKTHEPLGQDFLIHPFETPNKGDITEPSDVPLTTPPPKPVGSSAPCQKIEIPKPAFPTISQDSVWSASGDRFLNSPAPADIPLPTERTRLQSPDLDMTSAYTFQQSKLAKESKTSLSVKRVQIQDLLAQEPKDKDPDESISKPRTRQHNPTSASSCVPKIMPCSKRTFTDAFAELDDVPCHKHDGPSRSIPNVSLATGANQTNPSSTNSVELGRDTIRAGIEELSPGPAQQNTIRPAKRRRFVEVAACVALGGAGVLSALIMSAPSFT